MSTETLCRKPGVPNHQPRAAGICLLRRARSNQRMWLRPRPGRSKGFAFVEMSTKEEANSAIEQFNGKELGGRRLKVNEAKPRENRGGGCGRGGFGNGRRGLERCGGGNKRRTIANHAGNFH